MEDHVYIRIGKELLEKREEPHLLTTSPEKAMKNADEIFREMQKISSEIQHAYQDVIEK